MLRTPRGLLFVLVASVVSLLIPSSAFAAQSAPVVAEPVVAAGSGLAGVGSQVGLAGTGGVLGQDPAGSASLESSLPSDSGVSLHFEGGTLALALAGGESEGAVLEAVARELPRLKAMGIDSLDLEAVPSRELDALTQSARRLGIRTSVRDRQASAKGPVGGRLKTLSGRLRSAAWIRIPSELGMSPGLEGWVEAGITRGEHAGPTSRSRPGRYVQVGQAAASAEELPTAGGSSRDASLGLDGTLSLKKYRPPLDLRVKQKAAWTAHAGFLALSAAAVVVGFGAEPSAVAAGMTALRLWAQSHASGPKNDPPRAFQDVLYGDSRKEAQARTEAALTQLLDRMEYSKERRPRVALDNARGLDGAFAYLDAGDGYPIFVGESFHDRPIQEMAAVLAHELGHIVQDRFNLGGFLRTYQGAGASLRFLIEVSLGSLAAGAGLAILGGTRLGAWVWGAYALSGITWVAAVVLPLALLGLAAGFWISRLRELQADHFSAWLTRPEWLASYFERMALRSRQVPLTWKEVLRFLYSTHPSWSERIRRLRAR